MSLNKTILWSLIWLMTFLALWQIHRKSYRHPHVGDEPTYTLVAKSFLEDGDVDVRNNYAANQHLELGLPKGFSAYHGAWPIPKHPSLVPMLVAPALNVKGLVGLRRTTVFFGLLCLLFTWLTLTSLGVGRGWSWFAVLTLGLSPPLFGMSKTFFMEAYLAFFVSLGMYFLMIRHRVSDWPLLLVTLSFPFIHWRGIYISMGMSVVYLVYYYRDLVRPTFLLPRLALVLSMAAVFFAYVTINHQSLATIMGMYGESSSGAAKIVRFLDGFAITWEKIQSPQNNPLLWSPIWLMTLFALYHSMRRPFKESLGLVILTLTLGAMVYIGSGSSGASPPARIWTALAPAVTVLVAHWLYFQSPLIRIVGSIMALVGVLSGLTYGFHRSSWLRDHADAIPRVFIDGFTMQHLNYMAVVVLIIYFGQRKRQRLGPRH